MSSIPTRSDSATAHLCHCGRPATSRCSRCSVERYCSIECQRVDWPRHRVVCTHIRKLEAYFAFERSVPYVLVGDSPTTAMYLDTTRTPRHFIWSGSPGVEHRIGTLRFAPTSDAPIAASMEAIDPALRAGSDSGPRSPIDRLERLFEERCTELGTDAAELEYVERWIRENAPRRDAAP